jgi:hypothetical protein
VGGGKEEGRRGRREVGRRKGRRGYERVLVCHELVLV